MIKALKHASIIAAALWLTSCGAEGELDAFRGIKNAHTVWVFAQLNVDNEADGIDSYYYYGRISESLYNRIKNNEVTRGFLLLEDVRYYSSTDDKVHPYKDDEKKGELVFRIEDVKRIQLLSRPSQMDKPEQGSAAAAPAAATLPDPTPKQPAPEKAK
jgi:hypothetical protein